MIEYLLHPVDPSAHTVRVQVRIPMTDPDGQRLALAAWTPGDYRIRPAARHVLAVSALAGNQPIGIRKIDSHTWQCPPTAQELLVSFEFYARNAAIGGAYLDARRALFEGAALLPRVVGAERQSCSLDLRPPDACADTWQAHTTLPAEVVTDAGWGRYRARHWWDLIDHPIGIGAPRHLHFEVEGVPHTLVAYGGHDFDAPRIRNDLAQLCRQHMNQMGAVPHARYLFMLHCGGDSGGGLEHALSSTLSIGRDALPRPGAPPSRAYLQFLRLCSHEYLHLWWGKRLRPAAFEHHPLDAECHTADLWTYEGVTSYLDDYTLQQAGLVSTAAYLKWLAEGLTRLERTPGRMRQSLTQASGDVWLRLQRPVEHRALSSVSYYAKGALVALALDLELRRRCDTNLLTVLRELWASSDEGCAPLAEGALEQRCIDHGGTVFGDFFQRCVHGTEEPDWPELLADFGISATRRMASGSADAGGPTTQLPQRCTLGLRLVPGKLVVAAVAPHSAAQRCGLQPDDELVAFAGERLTPLRFETILMTAPPDEPQSLHWFSDEQLRTGMITPQVPQYDTWALGIDSEADEICTQRRRAWLGA